MQEVRNVIYLASCMLHGFICNHKVVMCQLREALFSKRK